MTTVFNLHSFSLSLILSDSAEQMLSNTQSGVRPVNTTALTTMNKIQIKTPCTVYYTMNTKRILPRVSKDLAIISDDAFDGKHLKI